MIKYISKSPEMTADLGLRLGKMLPEGVVLCLEGDLGAGKTLLVQNIALGLEIREDVTSPTFNLMNVYEGRQRLYHFDLYRLEQEYELEDIGFYDYTSEPDGVVVIEWADKFADCMPEDYILVKIDRMAGDDNRRELSFQLQGDACSKVFEEVKLLCQS